METEALVDSLSRPDAYPHPVDTGVDIRQTHISVVFLAGPYAYKIKKEVDFGFVDYSTLARRRQFCEAEVRLNRRLAADIYLATVPITEVDGSSDGAGGVDLRVGGEAEPVEWAVKMVRLPDEATLEAKVCSGRIDAAQVGAIGRRIASFHAHARTGADIARFARLEAVTRNVRENFDQTVEHIGKTVHGSVYQRVEDFQVDQLRRPVAQHGMCHGLRRVWQTASSVFSSDPPSALPCSTVVDLICQSLPNCRVNRSVCPLGDVIDRRATGGVACDTHGDLRLDHVYLRDHEYVIVDCIEFNERFRYADPVCDMAFLVMDFKRAGRWDLAAAFAAAYFEAAGADGRRLLAFYVAYRAVVRAKVEGFKAADPDIGRGERQEARNEARAHWLLALGHLEVPARRPALVLVGGLPGTGKSTVARQLARRANFSVIDSDVVRKQLAGLDPRQTDLSDYRGGIYSPAWSDKTYAECLSRAQQRLFEGQRVVVDASFHERDRRQSFIETGRAYAVRTIFFECVTSPQTARQRLLNRRTDVSDAGPEVYRHMADAWQDYSADTSRLRRTICAEGEVSDVVGRVVAELRHAQLV